MRSTCSRSTGCASPPAAALVNATLALLALIVGDDFVGRIPLPIALHPLATPYMSIVPVQEGPLTATLVATTLPKNAASPAVRAFGTNLGRAAHQLVEAQR